VNPIGRIDVEGVALLNDVVALLRRYVVLNAHAAIAVALWVVHTHAMEAAETTPYLHITSPEERQVQAARGSVPAGGAPLAYVASNRLSPDAETSQGDAHASTGRKRCRVRR